MDVEKVDSLYSRTPELDRDPETEKQYVDDCLHLIRGVVKKTPVAYAVTGCPRCWEVFMSVNWNECKDCFD